MFDDLEERLRPVLERVRARGTAHHTTARGGKVVRQVMQPEFLRRHLAALPGGAGHAAGLPVNAFQEADQELAEAMGGVNAGSPFMPHTPANSILQSLLTTCIESRAEELMEDARGGTERLAHALVTDAQVYRDYGPCDPRWVVTGLAEGLTAFERRLPFPDEPAPPVHLDDNARVIVIGDWGTGLPGAVRVANQVRARLTEGQDRQQHVIHLGDVYYCGWRKEYRTRFLAHWPVDPDDREILSWALLGNHDMYSGGHGYFEFLLHDHRFRGHWHGDPEEHQPSSHFSLENDHWQLLGLDSSFHDHDLAGSQEQWIADKVRTRRRTMLLSHHQPFSAYLENTPQRMSDKVRQALPEGAVLDAWLWGHEHRCNVYGDTPQPWLRFGSCIGNGGVPQLLPDPSISPLPPGPSYAPPTWVYDGAEQAEGTDWLRFGFAVLDFERERLTIRYIDEHNDEFHRETLA